MPISLMSMVSALPSQCSRLGPMTNSLASRLQWRWPRSVMAQRLALRLYSATFSAQWLSAEGWPPPRCAQA